MNKKLKPLRRESWLYNIEATLSSISISVGDDVRDSILCSIYLAPNYISNSVQNFIWEDLENA